MTTPRITDAAREAALAERGTLIKTKCAIADGNSAYLPDPIGHFVQQLLGSVCSEKDKEIKGLRDKLNYNTDSSFWVNAPAEPSRQ